MQVLKDLDPTEQPVAHAFVGEDFDAASNGSPRVVKRHQSASKPSATLRRCRKPKCD